MKILLLDDNEPIRVTLALILENLGHEPLVAENSNEAFEQLRTQSPDAFIMDLSLDGERGEDVYRRMRNALGSMPPTLVLSGAHNGQARIENLQGTQFLAKPFQIEDLVCRLASLLPRAQAVSA